ncbi:prolipoprotein diacylglyceryl transferase [Candidatus Peregrinibacteria bacterium]|nr:MAG: prolipoprotein diacylglyceryl transferase [Candidatus Peregrinibacteria bacterium]
MLEQIAHFSIGPITIHFYGFMYALGAVNAFFLTRWIFRKKGEFISSEAMGDLLFWTMLFGVLGGRFFYAFVYNPSYFLVHPIDIIAFWKSGGIAGMSIHGGLIGGMMGLWWGCQKQKLSFWRMADHFLPAIAIGLALGRLGNFVNGELVGRITEVPWGMDFGDGENRHPAQLYAVMKDVLLCAIFLPLVFHLPSEKRESEKGSPREFIQKSPFGTLSALFLMTLAVFRFMVEFFRAPDAHIGLLAEGLSIGQWLSTGLFLTGGILLLFLQIFSPKKAPKKSV